MTSFDLRLRGPGGEPVDLVRTLNSHGFVDLPPMRPSADYRSVELTLRAGRGRPRTVRIESGRRGHAKVSILGPPASERTTAELAATVRHVLRLDADLSAFYEAASADPDLSWVTTGAGRMVQSPTVFEDVVKTICTTNCTWSATTYLLQLARSVAEGELDLEAFATASTQELPDEELEERLLALPGVGPYAAAHVMMTLGRYHRLILDSWTRPTYAKKVGRAKVSDAAIERRFRRYGPYAGLAFWLYLTRDWVD